MRKLSEEEEIVHSSAMESVGELVYREWQEQGAYKTTYILLTPKGPLVLLPDKEEQ